MNERKDKKGNIFGYFINHAMDAAKHCLSIAACMLHFVNILINEVVAQDLDLL